MHNIIYNLIRIVIIMTQIILPTNYLLQFFFFYNKIIKQGNVMFMLYTLIIQVHIITHIKIVMINI